MTKTPFIITIGEGFTTGIVDEVLPMSENAQTPASSIPVPAGSYMEIDDYDVACGGNLGKFKLQQTNDGSTWFTIGALDVSGTGVGTHRQVNPQTPWRVDGGANVAIRVAITTPSALPVTTVINGFRVIP
jgi:hypothetical protein